MSSTNQSTPENLPDAATWREAARRATVLLGGSFPPEATPDGLVALGGAVRARAAAVQDDAGRLVDTLTRAYTTWNRRAGQGSQRLATAIASRDLVAELATADDHRAVELLAGYQPSTSVEACARSLETAAAVIEALEATDLALWDTARSVVGYRVNRMLDDNEIDLPLVAAAAAIERQARGGDPSIEASPTGADDDGSDPDGDADVTGGTAPATAADGTTVRTATASSRRVRSGADLDTLRADLGASLARGELLVTWQSVGGS